jgi:hypothetical protein
VNGTQSSQNPQIPQKQQKSGNALSNASLPLFFTGICASSASTEDLRRQDLLARE